MKTSAHRVRALVIVRNVNLDDSVDLLFRDTIAVATMDDGLEIPGGWVAIRDGLICGVGTPGTEPRAVRTVSVPQCLITPGFINTHHHIFQNLTRSYLPAIQSSLFNWLSTLYPLWSALDDEAIYVSAVIGLIELAMGGCTTSTDHLYLHSRHADDFLGAEIAAARDVGFRFHPTRGSMTRSIKDGGLPPESVCQTPEEVLIACEEAVAKYHDRSFGAMIKVALAPCSPFSVTPELMRETAEMAERLDVRLHTHLAEDPDEDTYCLEKYNCRPIDLFEEVGWLTDRSWVAHCVYPNADEIARLGAAGTGVAHCPSSNMLIANGAAPVAEFLAAGSPVGIGCDGSASTDSASLWMETRNALLTARLRHGPASFGARDALEIATLGGAKCLGRSGEIGVLAPGAVADLVCWPLEGVQFAGALSDPISALLRCGPLGAWHTVINGQFVVEAGRPVFSGLDEMLGRHHEISARLQLLS